MMKYIIMIAIGFIAVSCTTTKPLYDWKGYDEAVYVYTKVPDQQNVNKLVKIYTKLMNNSGGSRNVTPPGVCADYGYLLVKAGEVDKGKELLVKETELYPESKQFIDRIIKRFE